MSGKKRGNPPFLIIRLIKIPAWRGPTGCAAVYGTGKRLFFSSGVYFWTAAVGAALLILKSAFELIPRESDAGVAADSEWRVEQG